MIPGIKRFLLVGRGQSLTEVALIIGIVGLVFFGMQNYIGRGLHGKVKGLTDHMIGTEQSVYQQDVSGLEINTSDSLTAQDSSAKLKEFRGGAKSTVAIEVLDTTYGSSTEE
ncbi:MAG: hypothetical protein BWY16_00170 [Candidatus Omnitrophica bacterium ADurb.Bin205]|nr:MAG: hypothetical protein BWY16_00170 [Candidatus Omnitrophica bacterium ADurb.Bin205]